MERTSTTQETMACKSVLECGICVYALQYVQSIYTDSTAVYIMSCITSCLLFIMYSRRQKKIPPFDPYKLAPV